MWRFVFGFASGVYVNQHYRLPEFDGWIKWIEKMEREKRK